MYRYLVILLINFILNVSCSEVQTPKIAIIGGGIGGASASHFLSELFKNNVKIDLYEANKVGGRLATIKIDNNEYEAGGSVIHTNNKYMQDFVKLLGLEHRPSRDQQFAIWDGTEIIFKDDGSQIFTLAKLIYKYGIQPFRLNSYVNSILSDFSKIYDLQNKGHYFTNITSMLTAMNEEFPKLLQVSFKEHLLHQGYAEKLIDELIQAPLLVDYGQTTNIQSFVGYVSLAGASGNLWAIKGGNKKVPEHLIYRNGNVNVIPSRVKKIRYISSDNFPTYEIHFANEDDIDMIKDRYDIVILATPLTKDQKMQIIFEELPTSKLKFLGEYHTTVATFVKGDLNPNYFGLEEELDSILSCNSHTKINSVGKLDTVEGPVTNNFKIWKMFSNTSLPLDVIHSIFQNVDKVEEIAWKAYPEYSANIRVDNFKLYDGLYHINAIEWIASAMEMSAIGGRNVAILAHNEFLKKFTEEDLVDIPKKMPKTEL